MLSLLAGVEEVRVETTRPDGAPRRRIIWVVVDGSDVFVRSVRGDRGYWYQAALDRPDEVTLVAASRRIPVRAVPAHDEQSIARCTAGLESKYALDPALVSMVRPAVLGSTLRLEPR